jgi:Uma2 family endonuclease
MWLSFGTRLVWVVEPELRKVFVYRPGVGRTEVSDTGELSGEDVLPGFAVPVADIF